jgi:hypothetical protein
LNDPDGFGRLFREAQRIRAWYWADEIADLSDEALGGDMPNVQAQKLRIDTRKWLCARMLPDEFGDKVQVGGSVGSNVQINVNLPAKGSGYGPLVDGRAVSGQRALPGADGELVESEEDGTR